MSKSLVLKPRLSEQTYALAQQNRVYVFDVPTSANKHSVARAVVAQFDVKVEAVNIVNSKGKTKRTTSINGKRRGALGARSDIKKAFVKLTEGFSLPIFAAVEQAQEQEAAVQEKVDKAAAKQAQKETKETEPKARRGRGLRLLGKKEEEK